MQGGFRGKGVQFQFPPMSVQTHVCGEDFEGLLLKVFSVFVGPMGSHYINMYDPCE